MVTRTTYEISGPDTLVRGMEVRRLKPLLNPNSPAALKRCSTRRPGCHGGRGQECPRHTDRRGTRVVTVERLGSSGR